MKRILILSVACFGLATRTAYSQQAAERKARPKPTPCPGVETIVDCPAQGCGERGTFDPELNRQKNIASDNEHEPVLRSIAWMSALRNPRHFTAKNRDRAELRQIGEGQKITVVAWALAARAGSQESCNCKLKKAADTDNHIVLVAPDIEDPTLDGNEKRDSQTAEFTPRVRLEHPKFTQQDLESLIDPEWRVGERPTQGKVLVRVTGILMFDSEHFLRNPLKRHNNWEIHPVLKLEYCAEDNRCDESDDANWIDIESE